MKYLIIILFVFLINNCFAQNNKLIYKQKTNTRLNYEGELPKKTTWGTYVIEYNDQYLYFNNDGKNFKFKIDSISEKRIWLNDKKWVITFVENGEILIWTWENDSDTIFNRNILNTLKK
jgi:hypothetical protein